MYGYNGFAAMREEARSAIIEALEGGRYNNTVKHKGVELMRRIFDNRVYDTETAKKCASAQPVGLDVDSPDYYRETLYRKKTGEFFLHGEGNSGSRYGIWKGTSGKWGEKIMPLKREEAQEWAQNHLLGVTYDRIFGVVLEEDEEKNRRLTSYRLNEQTLSRINAARQITGVSASRMIDYLVAEYIDDMILALRVKNLANRLFDRGVDDCITNGNKKTDEFDRAMHNLREDDIAEMRKMEELLGADYIREELRGAYQAGEESVADHPETD